ncbi:hypothetical protein AAMO2058_000826400 [Amorphochlora amoebiformis]
MDKLDKPLDDITRASRERKSRNISGGGGGGRGRGRKGRGRGGGRGGGGSAYGGGYQTGGRRRPAPGGGWSSNSGQVFRGGRGGIRRKKHKRLFVSNISKELNDKDIWEVFEQMGYGRDKLASLDIHYDPEGRFLGTCLAVFKSAHDAHNCCTEFDSAEVDKQEIYIDFVISQKDLTPTESTKAIPEYKPQEPTYQQGYEEYDNGWGGGYNDESYTQGDYRGSGAYYHENTYQRRRNSGRGTNRSQREDLDNDLDAWHKARAGNN